ncbi:MAG: ATP-binding protein [Bacillota bacterium]
MNRSQQITREYEELREKSRLELEQKKNVVYEKIPRLRQIEQEMTQIGIEVAKAVLNSKMKHEELLEQLQKKQMDLKIEKAELLSANKYPIDYLELKHQCKACKDTGFVEYTKCSCYTQKEISLMYKQSNMLESFERENFDQFRLDYYSQEKNENGISPQDNMKNIFRKCVEYTNNFDRHNKNLMFIGKPGLGKTFLCKSIAKELLEAGRSVIYQLCPDLIDHIRKYKFDFDNEEQNSQLLNDIYNCDLLIIDDLGTELTTQFSGLAIYNILNRRIGNNKKLIISTNLDIDEIVKIYSDRITSRIFGSFDTFEFIGEDIRLKMHKII